MEGEEFKVNIDFEGIPFNKNSNQDHMRLNEYEKDCMSEGLNKSNKSLYKKTQLDLKQIISNIKNQSCSTIDSLGFNSDISFGEDNTEENYQENIPVNQQKQKNFLGNSYNKIKKNFSNNVDSVNHNGLSCSQVTIKKDYQTQTVFIINSINNSHQTISKLNRVSSIL